MLSYGFANRMRTTNFVHLNFLKSQDHRDEEAENRQVTPTPDLQQVVRLRLPKYFNFSHADFFF